MNVPVRSAGAAARRIYSHLSAQRRRQLAGTVALMVVGAFAELATIGAVLPFLVVITDGEGGRYGTVVRAVAALGSMVGIGTIALSALLLVAVAVTAGALRLALTRASQHVVFAIAHDLATHIYERTLHQPYSFHVQRNTSQTISGIEKVQYVLGNVLLPAMAGSTAAIVSLFVLAALIAVDPMTSLVAAICFVALYATVSLLTRHRLYRNGDIIAGALQQRVQTLQEGLGGIRDVLLDRSQAIFAAKFSTIDARFREAQATNQFIAAAPRYVVEAGAVVLVAALALYLSTQSGGVIAALPMLGALALGAQRLLPLVQQVYFSWSQIYGNRGALSGIADLLDMPAPAEPDAVPLPPFADTIAVERLSYRYPTGDSPALEDITLTIRKGMRVGLIGKSGSGKSTFADILMGLLEPGSGRVTIDGRTLDGGTRASWQQQIAHVPQSIFLTDASIAANIAFGRDPADIDIARVRAAARGAELVDFIEALPQAYETVVGERGIRLSGGQRQRIGIARALYKQAAILVFDEATSALDDETEAAVMAAIGRLSRELTVISIAHRMTTLRGCDTIVRLRDGRIVDIGTYDAIVGGSAPVP